MSETNAWRFVVARAVIAGCDSETLRASGPFLEELLCGFDRAMNIW